MTWRSETEDAAPIGGGPHQVRHAQSARRQRQRRMPPRAAGLPQVTRVFRDGNPGYERRGPGARQRRQRRIAAARQPAPANTGNRQLPLAQVMGMQRAATRRCSPATSAMPNATGNPNFKRPTPTWTNACVLGATGWCLAPYVGVWRHRWVECSVEAHQNREKQSWHAGAG